MKSRHCAALMGSLLLAGTLAAHAQGASNVTADKTVPAAKKVRKAGATSSAPAPAVDEKSQISYSLGLLVGNNIHSAGLSGSSVSFERVLAGLRDALNGKAMPSQEDSQRVQGFIEKERTAQGERNKAEAAKFLAANGKLPGIVTTASGLQYKILTPGSGASPKATDSVTVNYRGSLLDGTEFDSSYKRNQPADFTVGQVIKGWIEGLQLMKPGAKFEFFVPPELAYDTRPPQGAPIPPGALLKFEVELISVKPAAAPAPPPGGAMTGPKKP